MIDAHPDEISYVLPWQQQQWLQVQQAVNKQQLPHAILLTGLRGIGKHVFATRLAHALLCDQALPSSDACGQCKACLWLKAKTHPDLISISPEADSQTIKIAQIRQLHQLAYQTSHCGGLRIIIIEPAEAMNRAAANALLKLLEEPSDQTLFLLLCHQSHSLLATLRSRCQSLLFPPLSDAQVMQYCGQGENIQAHLPLLFGAPLRMQTLVETKRAQEHSSILQGIAECLDGHLEACQLAKQWQGIDFDNLLESLHVWIMVAIKLHLSEDELREQEHLSCLHTIKQHKSLVQLFAVLDMVSELKRHLSTRIAVNPALWREGLIFKLLGVT